MLGLAFSNAATASLVALARSALPHHTNRIDTGPPDPEDEEPQAVVSVPVSPRTAARQRAVLRTARERAARGIVIPPISRRLMRARRETFIETSHTAACMAFRTSSRRGQGGSFDGRSTAFRRVFDYAVARIRAVLTIPTTRRLNRFTAAES